MINAPSHRQCACHGGARRKSRLGDTDPVTGITFTPPAAPDQIPPGTYANGYTDPFAPGGSLNAAVPGAAVPSWVWIGLAGVGGLIVAKALSGGGRRR